MKNKSPQGPLFGRMILDCSTLLPGPFTGKLLALQGARVIKIENPKRPDGAKDMGNFYDDLNELKEIVPLDLKSESDRMVFSDLVKKADGLIEGFRPEAKKKLGLDRESLHRLNPRLVIVSLVGYPENSPLKDRAGHDLNFQARTGCLSLFNTMPALPLADLFSSYRAAFAMASELVASAGGRPGVRRVISMTESLEEVQSTLIREYKHTGIAPRYGKNLFSGQFPCYREYRTKDNRRISVGAIESKFWERFCEIIGKPHLKGAGYAPGEQGERVIQEVQTALEQKDWTTWEGIFSSSDCCVEVVMDYNQLYGPVAK